MLFPRVKYPLYPKTGGEEKQTANADLGLYLITFSYFDVLYFMAFFSVVGSFVQSHLLYASNTKFYCLRVFKREEIGLNKGVTYLD